MEPQQRSGAEEEARPPRSFHRAEPVLFRVPRDFVGSASGDSRSKTSAEAPLLLPRWGNLRGAFSLVQPNHFDDLAQKKSQLSVSVIQSLCVLPVMCSKIEVSSDQTAAGPLNSTRWFKFRVSSNHALLVLCSAAGEPSPASSRGPHWHQSTCSHTMCSFSKA